jgi:hypothetical protein
VDSNPNLDRCATFARKLVIQLPYREQNFPAGGNCIAGMIGAEVAHAKNRHEAVA